jgi:hypothetical protein
MKSRIGRTFGQSTRDVIEDPCVAQAPIPILAPPMICCPPMGPSCWRNPVGCEDIGCCSPAFCPPPPCRPPKIKIACDDIPCCPPPCDPRAHHLNRGPYACPCPCKPDPDQNVYRCCEPMSSSYAGHVPGFTFHSTGRTNGISTFGIKQYMQNCFYLNTFTK